MLRLDLTDMVRFSFGKLIWLLFAISLLLVLLNSLGRHFNGDEIQSIHNAWKILHGERIYVDFFEHHHPFLYYILTLALTILGETITIFLAGRVLIFVFLCAIFLATYLLTVHVFDKSAAIIALVLLSTNMLFIHRAIEIRPDVPQTLFGLLSLLFLFWFFETRSRMLLAISSISLAVSLLFLQKTIFLIASVGFLLLIRVIKRDIQPSHLLFAAVVFMFTLTPYVLFLWFDDSLSAYLFLNWGLNVAAKVRPFAMSYLIPTWQIAYAANTLVWVFYAIGLLLLLKTRPQRDVGILSVGLLLSVLLVDQPYPMYYMMAMPLVAMIAAYSVHTMFGKNSSAIIVLLVFAILLPSIYLTNYFDPFSDDENYSNRQQLRKIEYVLSISQPEDYVYDGANEFNIFRKDMDFLWFIRPGLETDVYISLTEYKYDIYNLIDRFKPKVISSYEIKDMTDSRITDHYRESDEFKGLFIRVDQRW